MNFIVYYKAPVFFIKYIKMCEFIVFLSPISQNLVRCYSNIPYFLYFAWVFPNLFSWQVGLVQNLVNPLPHSNYIRTCNQGICFYLCDDAHTYYSFTCATRQYNSSTSTFYSATPIKHINCIFLIFSQMKTVSTSCGS